MGDNDESITKLVEYRCQALKNTFGLIDHYYYVVDDKEYHLGWYKPGKILPKDTTKGYHIVGKKTVCGTCYNKIIADINFKEDRRLMSFYPLLNCESLCTGFSVQSLGLLALPLTCVTIFYRKFMLTLVIILTTICLLLFYSKYIFSRTKKTKCIHLS